MRSHSVIVPAPALDDDLGFSQRVEDFAVEEFVTQARVEAFDISVLPRAAGLDERRLRAYSRDPLLHSLSHELGP